MEIKITPLSADYAMYIALVAMKITLIALCICKIDLK